MAVTAVWGSTFVLIKGVVTDLPVLDFLAVRFAIAAVVMVVAFGSHLRRLTRAQCTRAVLLGVVYGVAQILQTYGLAQTPAAVSGFVTGTYVVITPVLGALLLRQRTPSSTWVAVGLATGGLALLALRGLSVGPGELLTLASAVLYAAHIVGLGHWSDAGDSLGLATMQMLAIAVLCTAAALPGGVALPADGRAWLAVLYTAIAAGAFALVVQTWAQAHLPATRAAVIMTMEPVFAAAFAVGLGGEHLTWRTAVGGLLVLTAMYVAELAPRRSRQGSVGATVGGQCARTQDATPGGPGMNTPPTSSAGEAEVVSLRAYRAATQGTESGSVEEDIHELGDRTPVQALSAAYAERIALVRALAPAEELMASSALIATLERTILRDV